MTAVEDEREIDLDTVYTPSRDMLVKQVQGEFIIIPLRKGTADLEEEFFKLNETAKAIYDKLDGKKTLKELALELSLKYDAALELIERELLEMAEKLLKRGVLVGVKELEPDLCQKEQEFSISGAVTIELIQATFAKGVLFRFKVKGASMSPFLRDQDIVTLSPVWRSTIGLGKLVACVCPVYKRLLIHRIVAKKGDRYLIKGDNCRDPDNLMDKEDILGCVISIERKNKTVFFSLGPEQIIIAFLSRHGLLSLIFAFWRIIPKPLRRFLKCKVLL